MVFHFERLLLRISTLTGGAGTWPRLLVTLTSVSLPLCTEFCFSIDFYLDTYEDPGSWGSFSFSTEKGR